MLPAIVLTLLPVSPALAPLTTDSVSVVFTATGGSVTAGGLFTAGTTPGTYRIIATSGTVADTATITVPQQAQGSAERSGPPVGIPFGPFGGFDGNILKSATQNFSLSLDGVRPGNIIGRIAAARSRGIKIILAMTGGAHGGYKTDGVFDMAKWMAKMDTYNTPAITAAVAEGVADGTIIGNNLMDEPSNASADNSWGPPNTMNKARVDSMAVYAKEIFPTLPMGVTQDYKIWNDERYHVVDFQISQYRYAKGDINEYREGALALAARDHYNIVFSLNVLDGGIPGGSNWSCPPSTTDGPGTNRPTCRMTANQVREWGQVLGPAGCAFLMWRYEDDYMEKPANQEAFGDVAKRLATLPAKPCKRP
jgi:hypothetical protein